MKTLFIILFPFYLFSQELKNTHNEIIFSVDIKQASITVMKDVAGNSILFVKTREQDEWYSVKGVLLFQAD